MILLSPRKTKYKKQQRRGRMRAKFEKRGTEISFGSFGLKGLEKGLLTSSQIEAARKAILRVLQKRGKVWIRVFPWKAITFKGVEAPMGGGKGDVSHYVFVVRPGRIIFEIDGVEEELAQKALEKAGDKLPIKTKFVKK